MSKAERLSQNILYAYDPLVPDNLSGKHQSPAAERKIGVAAAGRSQVIAAHKQVLYVIQQVTGNVIFIAFFLQIKMGLMRCRTAFALSIPICCVGCFVLAKQVSKRAAFAAISSNILLGLIFFTLAPVLKTLTRSTTDDSIWALSASLLLTSAILADYSSAERFRQNRSIHSFKFQSALSLNAAVSAAVVLASRYESNIHVFVFLWLGLAWFLNLPFAKAALPALPMTVGMVVVAQSLLLTISYTATILFTFAIAILGFVTPLAMNWASQFHHQAAQKWTLPKLRLD